MFNAMNFVSLSYIRKQFKNKKFIDMVISFGYYFIES